MPKNYKNIKIANTHYVINVYLAALSYALLIFPIFIDFFIYYDKSLQKLYYAVYAFGFIRVLCGYAEFAKKEIILHVSEKKAVLIEYKKFFKMPIKIKIPAETGLVSLKGDISLGGEENAPIKTMALTFINILGDCFLPYINEKNHMGKIEINETFYLDRDVFSISFQAKIVFNQLSVIIMILNRLLGALYEKFRTRKQNSKSHIFDN